MDVAHLIVQQLVNEWDVNNEWHATTNMAFPGSQQSFAVKVELIWATKSGMVDFPSLDAS